jgi:hypothetical protein
MAISPAITFLAGDILLASELNTSFSHITDNGQDLGWPRTESANMAGYELILDAAGTTSIHASTNNQIDFKLNGQDLFVLDGTTASAVNGLTMTASATGVAPTLAATGSDTNIGLLLKGKGAGRVKIDGVFVSRAIRELTESNARLSTIGGQAASIQDPAAIAAMSF